jgi:lysophospholipase L1-like esterase
MNTFRTLVLLFVLAGSFLSFKKKELTWVAIGDSITYLNDHVDETDNRVTKGYMTMVVERLPHIKYVNQGHNGWTSGGIAKEFDSLGVPAADIYSVFLGTNDWWQGRHLGTLGDYKSDRGNETVYGSFRIIVNKLRALNSGAHIVLITPMQRVDFVHYANMKNNAWGSYKAKDGQMLEDFAKAIDSIGKYENFEVVDLFHAKVLGLDRLVKYKRLRDPADGSYKNYRYPSFIDVPFDPEKDEYPYPKDAINMTYDGLHPSDKGYEVIAGKLVKVMKRY